MRSMSGTQGSEQANQSSGRNESLCIDCKADLNGGKVKSITCDFCKSWYCFKCSKLKQAIFNEIGKEESILWTCVHCRIALPGVNAMMSQIRNLEVKVGEIEKKMEHSITSTNKQLPRTEKELILEVIREEKEEESEMESRKLNVVIHQLRESEKGTLEDRKREDCDKVRKILNDELQLEVGAENVFRLGRFSEDMRKARPLRFTVQNFDSKRSILDSSKRLRNHTEFSNVFFTPDLTQNQRKVAFELRQEKRRRVGLGEENLVIRRGKIVTQVTGNRSDHDYIAATGPRMRHNDRPSGSELRGP